MVFGFGMAYCWLQTLLSYKLYKLNYRHGGVAIIIIRLILSISSALFFIISECTHMHPPPHTHTHTHTQTAVVAGDLAYRKYDGNSAKGTFVWTARDGVSVHARERGKVNRYTLTLCPSFHCQGFALHVTSTATEWLMGASFILYFLTFHTDFQRIRPDVIIRLRYHHSDTTMVNTINEKTPLI